MCSLLKIALNKVLEVKIEKTHSAATEGGCTNYNNYMVQPNQLCVCVMAHVIISLCSATNIGNVNTFFSQRGTGNVNTCSSQRGTGNVNTCSSQRGTVILQMSSITRLQKMENNLRHVLDLSFIPDMLAINALSRDYCSH